MEYDYDVIVVGGGPAGLCAAIRTRWVKRYKAVPCSTLLIEGSYLGGLASWQGCLFTGPSWRMDRKEIVSHLLRDVEQLRIDYHQARAVRIETGGEVKRVWTSDKRVFRALTVILATGIKFLVNERDYLGRGLEVTSMGYEAIVHHLKGLLRKRWEPRLIVIGSEKLQNLIPLIRKLNEGRSVLTIVMEGDGEPPEEGVLRGWVERYWGEGRLEGITVRTAGGVRRIRCGMALLDFNSYELMPSWRMEIDGDGLGSPFLRVNLDMETAIPGIFAAGDVTSGGYNSFSRAVAQGIAAGLSAYRYVFRKKFGDEPPLFAYRPSDFPLPIEFGELPPLRPNLRPKSLVPKEELQKALGRDWPGLSRILDGKITLEEIVRKKRVSMEDLNEVLTRLVEEKKITFHVEVEG
ncbi:MAG: hypothetical protein N3G78_08760 [Desulfobacterota bacterium]|nr:hypothetical protein [Thermodesulfobacteriota bacterium]